MESADLEDPEIQGYKLFGLLGRGGMGVVYKARQRSLDRTVAIKILPATDETDELRSAERFRNESTTMARLDHPGIVGVVDSGETMDGRLYFAMEFVEGTDLESVIRASGKLPQAEAMDIARRVCDALEYAHGRGVVHRDIKPANILIGKNGEVKVADFGLARVEQTAASLMLTRSNMNMGTVDYAAPELLRLGTAVDHRADIYAIGVMLYKMLTGDMPRGLFKMPSDRDSRLDPRFDDIICKAMEQERDLRYQSARDITEALEAIRTGPAVGIAKPVQRSRRTRIALSTVPLLLSCLLLFRGQSSESSIIDINAIAANEGNVAAQADVSSEGDGFGMEHGPHKATDGKISGGVPGESTFNESFHAVFSDFGSVNRGPYSDSTNELKLDFATAVDLVELVAYVTSHISSGADDADRRVMSVGFWVNTGSGLHHTAQVHTIDSNDIGGFDRVSVTGDWPGVSQVVFTFTPVNTQSYSHSEVRVAEVLTLTAVR